MDQASSPQQQSTTPQPNLSKSDFIRRHANVPAAEVVAKGKAAGLEFSPAFVHAVRSRSKPARSNSRSKRRAGKSKRANAGLNRSPKREWRRRKGTNASDFIREQLAAGKAPVEILAAASRAGVKFSRGLIYAAKSSANSDASPVRRRRPSAERNDHRVESVLEFKKLALELGIAAARRLLDDLEQRLQAIIAG